MVVGDTRWAGAYGVDADFIARSHVSVEFISAEDIEVCFAIIYYYIVLSVPCPVSTQATETFITRFRSQD